MHTEGRITGGGMHLGMPSRDAYPSDGHDRLMHNDAYLRNLGGDWKYNGMHAWVCIGRERDAIRFRHD
jgi:hypothetical protein